MNLNRDRAEFFIVSSSSSQRRAVTIRALDVGFSALEDSDKPLSLVAGLDGGTEWTDVLQDSRTSAPVVVSEMIREKIQEAGLSGIIFRRISFTVKGRVKKPPCKYFGLLPDGPSPERIFRFYKLNSDRSKIQEVVWEGAFMNQEFVTEEHVFAQFPVTSSWSGKDFMGFSGANPGATGFGRLGMCGAMVCSRKCVELFYSLKVRGIRARLFNFLVPNEELANLKWPPESWCDSMFLNTLQTEGYAY